MFLYEPHLSVVSKSDVFFCPCRGDVPFDWTVNVKFDALAALKVECVGALSSLWGGRKSWYSIDKHSTWHSNAGYLHRVMYYPIAK